MRCNKAKFNVVNRRHHCRYLLLLIPLNIGLFYNDQLNLCRKCGFVVCGDCSKNKFLILSQSDEPVRVCDICYDSLANENGTLKVLVSLNMLKT